MLSSSCIQGSEQLPLVCLCCATQDYTDLKSIPFWLESLSLPDCYVLFMVH